jgi:hypothetical protein
MSGALEKSSKRTNLVSDIVIGSDRERANSNFSLDAARLLALREQAGNA